MARLRPRSTEHPDPGDREAMLALRARHAEAWRMQGHRPLVDIDATMMAGLGLDGDERPWVVFPDGSAPGRR
jgi:hypothetical protein